MNCDNYFTLVFKGDLRAFDGNPFQTDTPFGRPVAVSLGDALKELEVMHEDFGRMPDGRPAP